jgi:threonine dehydrogenase-like Zn-dependent dehydrogenase
VDVIDVTGPVHVEVDGVGTLPGQVLQDPQHVTAVAVTRVRELTGGDGVDVVLDLTPIALSPVLDAVNAVRWGGTIVLAGLKGRSDDGPRAVSLPTDMLVNKGITVKGAFSVDAAAYMDAIRLIESGKFPLEKMQTHKFGLDDVEHAIQLLAGEVPGEDGIHVAIMPGL